ncbi:hypothetical protein ABT352_09245 [Streptosporangium sp. NPDC000563]|uniref:hypothetical protein n=1 Tax=unclassified Streptosporangium TaxID=2632669 RepID=UPI0033178D81
MRPRAGQILAIGLTGTLCVVAGATPAAAHYYNVGMAAPNFTVRPYSYNSSWQGPMDRALSNWNATATPAYIGKSSGSSSTIVAASYSNTWYGLYTSYGSYFKIQLNSRTISADASNFSNFVTSVFVHELGHALSLAHNDLTSIMNHGRPRNTMTTPQSHDVSDVNAYY